MPGEKRPQKVNLDRYLDAYYLCGLNGAEIARRLGVSKVAVTRALERHDPDAYRLERERRKEENGHRRREAERARKRNERRQAGVARERHPLREISDLAEREARRLYPRDETRRARFATRLRLRLTYGYLLAAALDAAAARSPLAVLRRWGLGAAPVLERAERLMNLVRPEQRPMMAGLFSRLWPLLAPSGGGAEREEVPAFPSRKPVRRLAVSTRELVTTYAASVYRRVPGVWDGEKCVWVRRERWVPEVRQAGLKTYSVPLIPVPEGNGGKKVERGVAWSGLTRA